MVNVETCSALYIADKNPDNMQFVVNSLFGDGCSGFICSTLQSTESFANIIDNESYIDTHLKQSMYYAYNEKHGKFEFNLHKDIPYEIGQRVIIPVEKLLKRNNLKIKDVDHWLVHTGGKKVLYSVAYNLGISFEKMRFSMKSLSKYGNVSSASLGFVIDELLQSNNDAKFGDIILFMTMGPGASIECCLSRFTRQSHMC
jgi:alkylresorcinol/alkylpyrone synthase/polyketide synthase Type III